MAMGFGYYSAIMIDTRALDQLKATCARLEAERTSLANRLQEQTVSAQWWFGRLIAAEAKREEALNLLRGLADVSVMKSRSIAILEADADKADCKLAAYERLLPGIDPMRARVVRDTAPTLLGLPRSFYGVNDRREITIAA